MVGDAFLWGMVAGAVLALIVVRLTRMEKNDD
jgi:hypothetical protein